MLRSALRMARARKDASSNVTTVGTRSSSLRQPGLAHPVKTMLEVLGVLVEDKTFVSFYCEPRVDPQHLRGFRPSLLKLSSLRVSGCEHGMRPLLIGQARRAFAQPTHCLPIAS